MAFELYATGTWSLVRLTGYLRDAGLISLPTPNGGGRPLVVETVHKMLKNPYYMGVIEYAGRRRGRPPRSARGPGHLRPRPGTPRSRATRP